VADQGTLSAGDMKAKVKDTQKGPNGQHVHTVLVESGTVKVGDTVEAVVNRAARADIVKNHTATHLLHQALKDVLGEHVNQAGSLVAPERLRFDFSHFGAVTAEELEQIEAKVNEQIWRNIDVNIMHKSLQEAKAMGAMALFGEKYGDEVRVVQVGNYSLELCGGCHVNNTAEIGLFKIVSEAGIGAGTRRIEAVTGRMAYEYLNKQLHTLKMVADELKTTIANVPQRIEALKAEMKAVERENESLRAKLSNLEASSLTEQVEEIKGVKVLAAKVNGVDMDNLRNMVDDLKGKLGSAIVVLGSVKEEKVNIVAGVTADLVQKGLHAGKAVKEVAVRCGGGGGGRPDMAQAGGKNPAQLSDALAFVKEWVNEQI
jgi:alanyl-tRNA synthetase